MRYLSYILFLLLEKQTAGVEREETERISGEALYYLEEISQIADFLHRDLYRSSSELEDLLQYFRMKPEEYQKYVLGRYISSEELIYKGTFYFMNEAFGHIHSWKNRIDQL